MTTTADPMTTVRKYIDGFNRGDTAAMAEAFALPGSILDGMAPHVWFGPQAAREWYADVLAEGEHAGASGYVVTLGEPRHVDVTENRAYVVVPAAMAFKVNGTQVTQSGAVFTAALGRLREEWLIMAWAWAKGGQS